MMDRRRAYRGSCWLTTHPGDTGGATWAAVTGNREGGLHVQNNTKSGQRGDDRTMTRHRACSLVIMLTVAAISAGCGKNETGAGSPAGAASPTTATASGAAA